MGFNIQFVVKMKRNEKIEINLFENIFIFCPLKLTKATYQVNFVNSYTVNLNHLECQIYLLKLVYYDIL